MEVAMRHYPKVTVATCLIALMGIASVLAQGRSSNANAKRDVVIASEAFLGAGTILVLEYPNGDFKLASYRVLGRNARGADDNKNAWSVCPEDGTPCPNISASFSGIRKGVTGSMGFIEAQVHTQVNDANFQMRIEATLTPIH
jgi:hypothetical protein